MTFFSNLRVLYISIFCESLSFEWSEIQNFLKIKKKLLHLILIIILLMIIIYTFLDSFWQICCDLKDSVWCTNLTPTLVTTHCSNRIHFYFLAFTTFILLIFLGLIIGYHITVVFYNKGSSLQNLKRNNLQPCHLVK